MGYCRCWHAVVFIFLGAFFLDSFAAGQRATSTTTPARDGRRAHATATRNAEDRTAQYLDSIRSQPSLLLDFVRRLPKGADLHNHLTGAVYAESLINYAAQDHLCIDRTTLRAVGAEKSRENEQVTCDQKKGLLPAAQAFADPVLYRDMVDAWSMRHFVADGNDRSAHDHFFDTFGRFSRAKHDHLGDMFAEAVSRAGREHLSYVEFILSPDDGAVAQFASGMGWNGDMAAQREKLIEKNIAGQVASARMNLDAGEEKMRSLLRCGSANADPGCEVTVRYLYEVHRGLGRDQVFAETMAGFEMAAADPRVVGVNLVMPEDGLVEMRDFTLHMQMLDFLHKLYPKVHISLHAGELAPGLVPPEGLLFHIRESVEVGHAERIGHGVDVMYERDPIGLLRSLRANKVLVEICLTSNDLILNVRGAEHPLPMYLKFAVPVALATDDEGVARSNIDQEYLRAIQTYGLTYIVIKRMVRNSLEHAFVAGGSLWADTDQFRRAGCQADRAGTPKESLSRSCQAFLQGSDKARLQWKLEGQLAEFENEE